MNFVRLFPVLVSYALLAAHFYRVEMNVLMVISLLIPFLLLLRKAWAARFVQVVLVLGVLEWIRALFFYASWRVQVGEPWSRLAVILIAVTIFTVISVFVFRSSSIKKLYGLK